MTDIRDDLLEQVVDELRMLPPIDEAAVTRIVSAAAAETRTPGGGAQAARPRSWWRSQVPLAAAAGFALAAAVGGFLAGDAVRRGSTPTAFGAREPASESVSLVSARAARASSAAPLRPQPISVATQFVLDAPRASQVALVGDFNDWNAVTAPLTRDSSSGIWTVTIHLTPGRHVYAFMVDGRTLTLDPRAPKAHDAEFGTPSSVVLVGTP